MNRSDMVRRLAGQAGLTLGEARHVLEVLFGTGGSAGLIADALDRGERVSIAGFGTFTLRERPARVLHDPRAGCPRRVAARRLPCFRPGAGLRDRLR